MSNWQLIETAPMDGTEIIGYDRFGADIVHWDIDKQQWCCGANFRQPTHWLALPKDKPEHIE